MFEKFQYTLLADDDILFFAKLTFFANEMGILGVDVDIINLDIRF